MAQVFEWPRSNEVGDPKTGLLNNTVLEDVCNRAHATKEVCARFQQRYKRQRQRIQTYLVTSRDGIHFDFSTVYAATPFVNYATAQRKECNFETVASNIVTHAGYHYVYYDCGPKRHDRFWGPSRIRLAQFEQDRLFGWVAQGRTGSASATASITSRDFVWPKRASHLIVNARAEGASIASVKVAVFIKEAGGSSTAAVDQQLSRTSDKELRWGCGSACDALAAKRVHLRIAWAKPVAVFGFELR
jgi:hypothetical protein